MTQILLEKIPADIKQHVCIHWLIYWVCGGVIDVEVITLILKFIKWDEELKNVIIGLLINTWNFGTEKPIFAALLKKVPDNELGTFLSTNFDIENFPSPNPSEWLFDKSKQSLLSAVKSSGAENYIESCLSSTQQSAIAEYVKSSPNRVTSELLALANSHLTDYCIPDHQQAKLQMYGVICYNDFEGYVGLERTSASEEARVIKHSLQETGFNMNPTIDNWSTYSLIQNLRAFCQEVSSLCSLVTVCIMSHGRAGLLYGCGGLKKGVSTAAGGLNDKCQINDIIKILGTELPEYIPKVCE